MSTGDKATIAVAVITTAGLAIVALVQRWRPRADRMVEVSGQVVERLNGEAETLHESLATIRAEFDAYKVQMQAEFDAYRVQTQAEIAEMQDSLDLMGASIKAWRIAAYRARGVARDALDDPSWSPDGWPREELETT